MIKNGGRLNLVDDRELMTFNFVMTQISNYNTYKVSFIYVIES